jgi:hypothetical protein
MHDTAHAPSRCRGHCVTTLSQIPFTIKVRRISFDMTQGEAGLGDRLHQEGGRQWRISL